MRPLSLLLVLTLFSLPVLAQDTLYTGSRVPSAQAIDALAFHNKVRSDVGAPPLQWSPELSKFAQAWAENLAANGCKMKHRPYNGEWAQRYGENIYMGLGRVFTPNDASKGWYGELKDYRYGVLTNENWYKTGHYTQMVWNKTTMVGMGMAQCADGAYIIVANYDPAGNQIGKKPY
jgi:pathogenesis-related protein 1